MPQTYRLSAFEVSEYLPLDLRKRNFEGVYIDETKGALDV